MSQLLDRATIRNRDEALLQALDAAIDALPRPERTADPETRALFRTITLEHHLMHMPPPGWSEPTPMAVLVMDRATRRRLARACRVIWTGEDYGAQVTAYAGVPIKVDDEADGRIYLVSLRPMQEPD